jgi:hypothetical protein
MKRQVRYRPCGGSGQPPVARLHQVGICSECGVRTFLEGDGGTDAPFVIQQHLGSRTDVMDLNACET